MFRGFGFITFSNADSVDKVLELSKHILDEKTVSVLIIFCIKFFNTVFKNNVFLKKIDPKRAFPRQKHPKVGFF